jgi:hypothetical protein
MKKRRTGAVRMVLLLAAALPLLIVSCGGLQQRNETVVLSDNRTADNMFPTDSFLHYLLFKQNVSVAVLAGQIRWNDSQAQEEEWRYPLRTELLTETENHLRAMAAYYSRFSLNVVDRKKLDAVLADYDTNNLIRVPGDLRVEIGRQTKATHILLVNFSRNYDGRSHTRDVTNRFLVNVATGRVEAVDFQEERNPAPPAPE